MAAMHQIGSSDSAVMRQIGASHSAAVLLGLAVLVCACLVARWQWSNRAEMTKDQRGRLRQLVWCAALLVLSVSVARMIQPLFGHRSSQWWLLLPLVVLIIIVARPRLAARIVPVALILYGLCGFAVARDYAFGGAVHSYGLTSVGNPGIEADLILPQAYAFLLLGGWLALRSADPVLVRARSWLGPVADAPLGEQLRTLALLPVVAVIAGMLMPRIWLAAGGALILTLAVLCAAVLIIRRRRVWAAQQATVGLLCLGIAGLAIAAAWHSGSPTVVPSTASARPAPTPAGHLVFAPARQVIFRQPTKSALAPARNVIFRQLTKPTLISPPKSAFVSPATQSFASPGQVVVLPPPPVKSTSLVGTVVSPPPTLAADVADVAYGQALPFGAVLLSSPDTAEAAAVEGLAFLALGAWLAPQTFPRVRRLLGRTSEAELSERVERLTKSRAVAVDTASADLRRLERDLHDGAQARLVALGMSLRAAERLIPISPEAALALVVEARETSVRALTELRELVRGVLPPVLADRGLADAVRALALDSPLHVQTDIDLPGRLPAPVETACYFAVAELLTNAAKHSGARDARIAMSHSGRLLRIEVTDFGLGGADPAGGSGLAGVERRLATFDGILAVSSPPGGPTIVVMEVPCALSPPRTSSC
jgi:signal transduction histidine kinase